MRKPIFALEWMNCLTVYTNDDKWYRWVDKEWLELDKLAALPQPEPVKKPAALLETSTINVVEFLTFWDAYQHKVARSNAEKAWNKLCVGDKMKAMAAVATYVERTTTDPHDGTRRPLRAHAATWLNARRWEDEIDEECHHDEKPEDVL